MKIFFYIIIMLLSLPAMAQTQSIKTSATGYIGIDVGISSHLHNTNEWEKFYNANGDTLEVDEEQDASSGFLKLSTGIYLKGNPNKKLELERTSFETHQFEGETSTGKFSNNYKVDLTGISYISAFAKNWDFQLGYAFAQIEENDVDVNSSPHLTVDNGLIFGVGYWFHSLYLGYKIYGVGITATDADGLEYPVYDGAAIALAVGFRLSY